MRRRAVSLIEVLVAIAIIGVLIGLIVPIINIAREAASKSSCQNNFHQIGIALQAYLDLRGCYPPAYTTAATTTNLATDNPPGWAWGAMLLPYLDQESLYVNAGVGMQAFGNGTNPAPPNSWTQTEVPVFRCPSDSGPALNPAFLSHATSNYVAVGGISTVPVGTFSLPPDEFTFQDPGGVLFPNSKIKMMDITDGLSNTLAVGENRYLLGVVDYNGENLSSIWAGWTGQSNILSGELWGGYIVMAYGSAVYPAEVPGYSGLPIQVINGGLNYFSSNHPGDGAFFLFCDGAVHFLPQTIDPNTMAQLSCRNDGGPLGFIDY
jgi:prepilin-type N-terminal cleavage/methylation domain-containing protein